MSSEGIDTAGYRAAAVFGFPFLAEIMSEEEEADALTVQRHPSEQIFDGDRGFVLR